jgi:4-amino-4-deoxy-L-arabinose transferase-like glycosyltransferase
MTSNNRSYYAAWIALLLVILLTAALRVRLLDVPLERDEGEYAYAAQLMLDGVPPYELAYNMKMPGIYAAYALVIALFGQTHVSVHIGLLLVNAATILLLFLLARRLFGPLAGVAAAAAFALLSVGAKVQGIFANAEHFVILPVLGGLLLLLRALDSERRAQLFFAAALLGLAPMMKQHGAAFVLFGVLFLVYHEALRKPFSWGRVVNRALLYGIGSLLPFGLTCLLLWWSGVFGTFWFWTFEYAREYVASVSLGQGIGLLARRAVDIPGSALALWLLAAASLPSFIWRRTAARQTPFVLGFLLFSFIAICPGFYFRPHYFVLLLPAVALLAGVGADCVYAALSRVSPRPARLFLALLVVILIAAHALHQQQDYFFRLSPTQVAHKVYGANPFPESLKVADFIRQNARRDDRIAILGSEPQIYFYTGLRSATGYIYTYGLMETHPYAGRMQQEMIAEIEEAEPRFLVFVKVPTSWLSQVGSDMTIFSWFEQYGREHYQLVGLADIGRQRETRYVWGAEALRYRPRSEFGILVFVRRR